MVNRVIRLLIIHDFILNFAFGLLAPIFAVFILQSIEGSTLKVVGLGTTFYWLARVISTVPLSRLMDKTDGERDEYYFAIIGAFITSSIPLFFLLISDAWHLYLIQFIHGLANSMAVPAWRILFTDHLDRGKTGLEWSLEDVAVGSAVAVSAFLGSVVADAFGFRIVLVILAMLGYLSTMFLIPIYRDAKTLKELRRQGRLRMIQFKRSSQPLPKVEDSH